MEAAADLQYRLGEAIKDRRRREGLSQEDLAFRSDLHTTFLSEIENGHKDLRLSSIRKVAEGLGISVLELIALAERTKLR